MQDLIISLSENLLKISTIHKGEFSAVSAELEPNVANDNKILDLETYKTALSDLISQVTKTSKRNLNLNFVVEPGDTFLKFVTINKTDGDTEAQIVSEIQSKYSDFDLENMYFGYSKIAPFVYQFVGIKKDTLEMYLEIANSLEMSLGGVYPWVLFMPKFEDINDPAIFISKPDGIQLVALSEFGGIFFTGTYDKEKTTEELQDLVKELSVYKRTKPITKIYTYRYDSFSLTDDYQVLELDVPNTDQEGARGYELHLLVTNVIEQDPGIRTSVLNLLSLLPVPVNVESNNKSLVLVGTTLVALLMVGGFFGYRQYAQGGQDTIAPATQDNVLSENAQPQQNEEQNTQEEQQEELNREDLTIRVENAAGIAGIAGSTQEFLENLGYTVSEIDNANEVGQQTTTLYFKPDMAKYAELVQQDMKDNFVTEIREELDEDVEYDLLVQVGTDANL